MSMLLKVKPTPSDIERLVTLQTRQERFLIQQFTLLIAELTNEETLKLVRNIYQNYNLETILQTVDDRILQFSNALSEVFIAAGNDEADHQAAKRTTKAKSSKDTAEYQDQPKAGDHCSLCSMWVPPSSCTAVVGEISAQGWCKYFEREEVAKARKRVFNPLADNAIAIMQRNRTNFAQNLTRQQRNVIRESLIEGIRNGDSTDQIAQRFRHTVGLTDAQRDAVVSYQRSLEQGNRSALERTLRPTQYDERVASAVDGEDVLSASQIERMVGAYTRNLQAARARTIAETETLKIINQAKGQAVRQLMQDTGTRRGTKTWLRTSSREPRITHLEAVGQTVDIDEPFEVGGVSMLYPGDTSLGAGPEDVIQCKCGVRYDLGEDG